MSLINHTMGTPGFLVHLKKTQPKKKSRFGKKNSWVYFKLPEFDSYREYTETKKKLKKNFKKSHRNFPQNLTLPGFESYKIPEKCTKSLVYHIYLCDAEKDME